MPSTLVTTPARTTHAALRASCQAQAIDYSSIYHFEAVIDWIRLRIVTAKPTNYYTVTRRMGIGHAAPESQGPGKAASEFVVTIQDPKSWAEIETRLARLTVDHPLIEPVTVTGIEIALDAYSKNNIREHLVAMVMHFYQGMTKMVSSNRRLHRGKKGKHYGPSELTLIRETRLLRLLSEGYNINIGNRVDAERQHVYLKETDRGGIPLPVEQHRARTEFTLEGDKVPRALREEWKAHDFTKQAEYFKFRLLKANLSPFVAHALKAKPQWGERRPRRTPHREPRFFSRSTFADRSLNALAFEALRNLDRRMHGKGDVVLTI